MPHSIDFYKGICYSCLYIASWYYNAGGKNLIFSNAFKQIGSLWIFEFFLILFQHINIKIYRLKRFEYKTNPNVLDKIYSIRDSLN